MRINTAVYGTPEQWINNPLNALNANRWNYGKCAAFGKLEDGVTQNKVAINQHIDRSLSWCGLGAESNYNKVDIYNAKDSWSKKSIDTENTQFFFYSRPDINFTWNNTDFQIHQATNSNPSSERALWYPIPSLASVNKHRFMYPIVDIDLQKLKFLIKVRAATDTTFTTQNDFDFNDYKNNHTGDYPIIRKIYAMPYNYNNLNTWGDIAGTGANYNFFGVAMFHDYPTSWDDKSIMYTCFDKSNSNDPDFTIILYGARNNRYSVSQNTLRHVMSIGHPKYTTVGSYNYFYQDTDIANVLEGALKTIACFGVFFILDSAYIQTELDNDNVYMGVIPDNGITHGEYTHGAANRDNPNWSWTGTKDSTYDYTKPVTNYDNNSPFNSLSIAAFNKMYAIQKQTAGKLAKVLSNGILSRPAGTPIDEWLNDTFLTSNPLDTIVSLKKFPMSVLSGADFTAEKIYFGAYSDDNIKGIPYTLNPPYRIYTTTFTGENMFKPEFGDSFLDYEPFTNVSLYLPFCGTVKIPVAEFMGHDINITYTIDLISGSVAAYVRRDNLNILSAQGTCAIDIPVSGIQGATLDSQIFQSSQNLRAAKSNEIFAKTAAFGSALNVAQSKSYTGILNTIGSEGRRLENATLARQGAEYELSHIELPLKQVGGASPLTSQLAEFNCRLIIERPVLSPDYDPEVYADTVGFACLINGKVSDFTGLTEASINLDSVNCTADEKKMIASAFANGVYL